MRPDDTVFPDIPGLRVEEVAGSGATGVVYRATTADGCPRAVKVLRTEAVSRAALLNEFRILRSIRHPGICPVHAFDVLPDGRPYLVMDWIDGVPMQRAAFLDADGRFDERRFYHAVRGVADALNAIHTHRLVHGDIKPENILITPAEAGGCRATLMDFGASRVAGAAGDGLTGTLDTIAPELIRGLPPTPSTDLYALGCVLYETVAGHPPFAADTVPALLRSHLTAAPPPLDESVPAAAADWIAALLAKRPQERFSSAFALAAAAAEALGEGSAAAAPERAPYTLPDIPRDAERAKARELFDASERTPAVLLVEGPEGAGKSRFLQDLRADLLLAGAPVFSHACAPRRGVPDLLADLFRTLSLDEAAAGDRAHASVVRADAPALFPGVPAASKAGLPGEAAAFRLAHASASLLLRRAPFRALLFDDLHRADPPVLAFIARLISAFHAASAPGIFIAAARDSDAPAPDGFPFDLCTRIPLSPLPPSDVSGIVRSSFGETISPSFATVLSRQSEGIPGRLEELIRFCIDDGILEQTAAGWTVHERENLGAVFPASVEESFRRKTAALADGDRALLGVLALAVSPVPLDDLPAIAGMDADDTLRRLDVLERAGLVAVSSGSVQPLHPALAGIAVPDAPLQREIHDRYLRLLESADPAVPRDAAVMAHHAYGSSHPHAALPWLRAAAADRQAASQFAEADALLQNALRLAHGGADPDVLLDILERLIAVNDVLGRRAAQTEYIEEMLVLAARTGSPANLARVYRVQTEFLLSRSEFERAKKSAEKALACYTDAQDALGQADCHRKIGFAEYRTTPGPSVVARYEAARDIYRAHGAAEEEGGILVDLGLVHYSVLEQPEKALACFDEARAIFERIGSVRGLIRAHGNTGAQHYALGHYDRALESHARANDYAREIGDRRMLATSLGSMGQCEVALCLFSPAQLHLEEELRIARELRDPWLEELCLENLGELSLALGAYDRSMDCYRRARVLAERSGNTAGTAACDIDIAGSLIELHGVDEAAKLLRQARATLDAAQDVNISAMWHYRMGMLHLVRSHLRDEDKALEHFRALGDVADENGFRSLQVLARSYAGLCQMRRGRHGEALELSASAVALLDAGGPLYGGAHDVLYNHAQILRANGRQADAAGFIDRAHTELMRSAESIADVQLYRAYVERVRVNAEIVREYTLSHRTDSKDALAAVREQNLRTLYDVSRKINSVLDLPALLDNIMDSALEAMNGERGLIFLIENDQLALKVSRNVEKETIRDATEISLSILRDVVAGGAPIIVSDTSKSDAFRSRESVVNYHIHSLVCVPMRSKDRLIGTVYVDSRSDAVRAMTFSELDAEFLEAFANLATIAIENARLHARLQEENLYLRREVHRQFAFENIVGDSAPMQRLFAETQAAIASEGYVLISGESGTGKELVAKAIHYNGARRNGRFVAVDCGALPDTLLESELFGYKRGAFTGAYTDKQGLFEEAHNGTLFLDEISNTSLAFQAKLLRVLQEGEFRRVGDTATRTVNVRIVCATNTDLAVEIGAGRFRQDLFYRLNVIPIVVPALRDRLGDIPLLVQHFVARYNEKNGTSFRGASSELLDALRKFPWRGNVRELENLVNRMLAQTHDDVLTTRHLPSDYQAVPASASQQADGGMQISLSNHRHLQSLQDVEREHILTVLQHCANNKTEAARILGLKRTTLIERMKKLGIM